MQTRFSFQNVGKWDRVVRLVLAAILSALYFGGVIPGTAGLVLLGLAAVLIVTAVVRFCPLYTICEATSCRRDG